MDKASVYGTGDCRFESYQGHLLVRQGRAVPPAGRRWFTRRSGISGLVVEYIVAIDVTRVRFPADAFVSAWLR